jgi:hypothetical protein
MKKRLNRKKGWVMSLGHKLDRKTEERLKRQLDACTDSLGELEELRDIKKSVDSVKEEIDRAALSVDWEALADQVTEAAYRNEAAPGRRPKWSRFLVLKFRPRLRPFYAGVAAGILIGILGAYLVLKPGLSRTARGEKLFASKEFVEKVELEMARRETLDYLEKSQYVLLDFVQVPAREAGLKQGTNATVQAKDLLSKKKYLDSQLDKFQMAKAKQICDQIEVLFYELSQMSSGLSEIELRRIQNLIRERQLLLKINLVKKELQKSEV